MTRKAATTCKCGGQRRPGQRTCRVCHAAESRAWRANHVMVPKIVTGKAAERG